MGKEMSGSTRKMKTMKVAVKQNTLEEKPRLNL
jgi:hypothetical protein